MPEPQKDVATSRAAGASSRRIVALLLGCLLLVPGISVLLGGGGLALAYAFGRDDAGYFSTTVTGLHTRTAALVDRELPVTVDPGVPVRLLDGLDPRVRLRVAAADGNGPLFVGIGPVADVDRYLATVAHENVVRVSGSGAPLYDSRPGDQIAPDPATQTFWAAQATGPGPPTLTWTVASGRWAVVVMNADGTPGVAVDTAEVGIRSGLVLPLAFTLLGVGVLLSTLAAFLIIRGAAGRHDGKGALQVPASSAHWPTGATAAGAHSPVALTARLEPGLSRWFWLVKWFLVVPHLVVLAVLWPVFLAVTAVAGVWIVCTGRYPRSLFAFNVGVLRWSWRVSYYAAGGGIGTDRYPPFTLGPAPDYPATLDIDYPRRLSRPLVLVKWWLLAIPQYVVVGLLVNGWWGWTSVGGNDLRVDPFGGGILGLLVLFTGIVLLVTGRYPRPLFDLIVGLNRWVYRVIAYAALMTDIYPPFRLDEGGSERPATLIAPDDPATDSLDLRVPDRPGSRR